MGFVDGIIGGIVGGCIALFLFSWVTSSRLDDKDNKCKVDI